MIVRNEDIEELIAEIPEGHKHIRLTMRLKDGSEFTFQEASVANLVRAYIDIKTHPVKRRIRMVNKMLPKRKEGYAEWQLIEEEPEG
ncbi:MAG: hypothetical protein HY809_00315 [Nitrospirae bacterium]|nr:hypothetical protein [Nitrospirota bacterium]